MKKILIITDCENIHQINSDDESYFYVPVRYLNSPEEAELFGCGQSFHAIQIIAPINKNQFENLMGEVAHRMIK